jgi:hypothetical protein
VVYPEGEVMAKYRITGPDGNAYEVTAPDTASEADVLAYAKQNYKAKPLEPLTADPTEGMSGMEKFNAGVGKAFADLGRGVGQKVGLVSNEDVKESRARDAALMKTGAGMAGNIGGNIAMIAPAALVPGAATVPGAAVVGGLVGALQPSASTTEAFANTGLGAAGGATGQFVANKAAGNVAFQQAENIKAAARNAQKTAAARAANQKGYVLPPEDIGDGGGALARVASGFGGKIKTAQEASHRNQPVTDRLARQALGLNEGDELTSTVLQNLRQQAAQRGYEPVKASGMIKADQQYFKALDDIAASQQGVSKSFPGLGDNGVLDLTAKLQQPLFDAGGAVEATKLLRANADKAYREGDPLLGKANRAAADAMEELLERHLQSVGMPDALKAFRDARQLIAKTYSVQKGLNDQTGSVAAGALVKQLQKGRPLTGELRAIAEAGAAFPKATQTLKEAPKNLSPLDMLVAGGGVASGNPLMAAWLGRPVVRNMLLSKPAQNAALSAAETPQSVNALMRVLANEEMMMPLGIAGGTALGR